jgi:hypothetical protein
VGFLFSLARFSSRNTILLIVTHDHVFPLRLLGETQAEPPRGCQAESSALTAI